MFCFVNIIDSILGLRLPHTNKLKKNHGLIKPSNYLDVHSVGS